MFGTQTTDHIPVTASFPSSAPRRWNPLDRLALIGTIFLVGVVCLGQSSMKLFWYDELITLHTSNLPSASAIFHFFQSGKDTTSFLPAMLVHVFQKLPGRPELTTRLPFTLAYLVTCLCVWLLTFRRYGAGFATAGVLLFVQGWTLYFASEIRAYAFLLMGVAIALVCWQGSLRSPRRQAVWSLGVFLGLSIAVLFHFFAIFLVPPLLAAEWFHSRYARKVRWDMLAAILLSPATIIVMLPNMLAAHRVYGRTFWSKPTLGLLTGNYQAFFEPVARNTPELLVMLAVLLWAGRRAFGLRSSRADAPEGGYLRSEWVLLICTGLVPVLAFAGGQALGV